MSNEQREQQMMAAADRYADEVCDESCTGAQEAETINDFCAGWRAADQHPHWIPVEERLPPLNNGPVLAVDYTGHVDKLIYTNDGWENSKVWCATKAITHWMPLPQPPRKEE